MHPLNVGSLDCIIQYHRTLLLIRLTHTRIRTYWLCLGEHLMTFLKLLRAILPADRDAVSWRVYDTP